jgi:predicted transposase/invertase (TIGR01784 family)
MLDVLKRSKKWVPRFEEEMKLKKEKGKIREEAKEERSLEIAKKMKKKGETIETISEYTGLSKEEIENI